jgi:hypothetical protein
VNLPFICADPRNPRSLASNSHFGSSSLKSEARIPKSEKSPKPERPSLLDGPRPTPLFRASDFGLLSAFGLRISELGRWPTLKMRIAGPLLGFVAGQRRGLPNASRTGWRPGERLLRVPREFRSINHAIHAANYWTNLKYFRK